jgi:hypothetical protein
VLHLVESPRTWVHSWIAANIPTQEDFGSDEPRYQPRYLSDSGRLFFNSGDALVPQDVNGEWDVYEYEPAGIGTCTAESQTFHEEIDGCVGLISSGHDSGESAFMGASETGGDVFFATANKLVPQDTDEQVDIYDAHECTALSPCVVPHAVSTPAPCTESETCRPGSVTEQPVFGAPGSAALSGAGNLEPVVSKPKPLSRAQMLAKALKTCRRKPKKKRANCETQARNRYGPRKHKKMARKARDDRKGSP